MDTDCETGIMFISDQELCPIEFSDQYYQDREEDFINGNADEDWLWEDEDLCENDEDFQWEYFQSEMAQDEEKEEIVVDEDVGAEVLNEDDRLFIFTTGRLGSLGTSISNIVI